MINPTSPRSDKYFLIGCGLLSLLAFTLVICGLTFLSGGVISKWQFPLACLVSLAGNYFFSVRFMGNKAWLYFLKTNAIILVCVISSIIISGFFYDTSFDGQWYHQETVYHLKQGYNPVYQTLPIAPDSVHAGKALGNLKSINVNNFAKGTEVIEAAIYQLTGRIETGKAVNGILLVASFFLCLSLLYRINTIGVFKKWLLAVLLAFNPIAVTQIFSFCVDGNVACLLLCLFVVGCFIFMEVNKFYLFILVSILCMAINIKYTSLVFAAMYGIGFLLVLVIYKKRDAFKQVFITCIISAFIGVLVCGINPYITNIGNKHNIFYGLTETRAEIFNLTPPLFKNLNRFQKLSLSIFAHQGWHAADKGTLLHVAKIPFTFNKEDIREAGDPEDELSGFGPFYGGAFIIGIVALVIASIRFHNTNAFKLTAILTLIILATTIIMPDSWWLRFVPQLWLLPVTVLCFAQLIVIPFGRLFKGLLYASLSLSVIWALLSVAFDLSTTERINYQLQQLKALNQPVEVDYATDKAFNSNQFRFLENGLTILPPKVKEHYIYSIVGSSTKFETNSSLPDLPKPILLKLSEKISGK